MPSEAPALFMLIAVICGSLLVGLLVAMLFYPPLRRKATFVKEPRGPVDVAELAKLQAEVNRRLRRRQEMRFYFGTLKPQKRHRRWKFWVGGVRGPWLATAGPGEPIPVDGDPRDYEIVQVPLPNFGIDPRLWTDWDAIWPIYDVTVEPRG